MCGPPNSRLLPFWHVRPITQASIAAIAYFELFAQKSILRDNVTFDGTPLTNPAAVQDHRRADWRKAVDAIAISSSLAIFDATMKPMEPT